MNLQKTLINMFKKMFEKIKHFTRRKEFFSKKYKMKILEMKMK